MNETADRLWQRYQRQRCEVGDLGVAVDPSRLGMDEPVWQAVEPGLSQAFEAVAPVAVVPSPKSHS